MNIDGKTKITGLFGYPVEHTLSPLMHNAAFSHLGLNYCYLPFQVHPDSLAQAVNAIRALNMKGVNVTVPHKEAVIPFLDVLSEEASFIGAVNTVLHRNDSLTGFNTDGKGFMASLAERDISVKGKSVLIVGCGGASRAISYYLSEQASALYLFDTDQAKMMKLAADLKKIRTNIEPLQMLLNLGDFEIIINATPLGLKKDDPLPFDLSQLKPRQTVCDLIYRRTALLERASEKGCTTLDGLGMLLWQGVLAFEIWTSVRPPVDVMKKALSSGIM